MWVSLVLNVSDQCFLNGISVSYVNLIVSERFFQYFPALRRIKRKTLVSHLLNYARCSLNRWLEYLHDIFTM